MDREYYKQIVPVSEIDEWRKKHPGRVSVRVQYSDSIARLDFEAIEPSKVNILLSLGSYMADGTFIFYDKNGTKHTIQPYRKSNRL